jgi:GTPase SAR1 family protein
MSNFPVPEPDRRMKINFQNNNTENSNFYKQNLNEENLNNSSLEKLEHEKSNNNMAIVKLKHIEDMRQKILNYKLLSEKTMFLTSNSSNFFINKCNIILFGPSGSGKSSFIKSMYRSLYNNSFLPPDAMKKLIIKDTYHNEGTLLFSKLHLKEENNNSSGFILCDTRGHIKMNDNEKEQFKILLDGNVKDNTLIEQRNERNPLALWEFWKKDSELFPKEIFNAEEIGIDSFPHSIIFVFDGSSDEVIQKEDETFYKELVNISKRKGYENIHIILTRIDIFEKLINERNKSLPSSERSSKVNTLKDEKIEKVIDVLGVHRSNIHFIENYHSEIKENSYEIDYSLLKTMCDIINACELYILYYMNKNESCFATCFGGR